MQIHYQLTATFEFVAVSNCSRLPFSLLNICVLEIWFAVWKRLPTPGLDEQEVISFFFQCMQTSQAAYYWNEDNFNFCFMKLLFRNLKIGEMKKSKKVNTAEICFKYHTACLRETLLIIVFFFLLLTFGYANSSHCSRVFEAAFSEVSSKIFSRI